MSNILRERMQKGLNLYIYYYEYFFKILIHNLIRGTNML